MRLNKEPSTSSVLTDGVQAASPAVTPDGEPLPASG